MTSLLKVAWLGPMILASTMLWIVLLGVLPALLAWALCLAGLSMTAVLATGALEELSLRVLLPARRLREVEAARLGPVLRPLGQPGLLIPSTTLESASHPSSLVLVRTGVGVDTAAVEVVGRRRGWSARGAICRMAGRSHLLVTEDRRRAGGGTVLLSPAFVEAVCRGDVSDSRARQLVVHAVGRHRASRGRHLVLCGAWLMPCRLAAGLLSMTGRMFGSGGGATGGAWRFRGVVGVVVLVRAVGDLESGLTGRAVAGFAGACVVMATYVVPAAHRAWRARMSRAGDRLVANYELAIRSPACGQVAGDDLHLVSERAREGRRLHLVRN